MDVATAALRASRLVQFAAVMMMFGGSVFPLYAGAGLSVSAEVAVVFDRWLRRVLLLAAVLSFLSSLSWLSIEAAMMGNGWSDAVSGSTLATVLLQTEFGHVWIVHLALAGILGVALIALPDTMSVGGTVTVAGLSAVLVASLAWTGHAVVNDGFAGAIDLTAQAVHLLAASLWLGGLVPLGYILFRARKDSHGTWRAAAGAVLPRYSRAGQIAVILILLTGIFISWSVIGSLSALLDTTYGRVLLAKIALFLLMVGMALANRLNHLPKIVEGSSAAGPDVSMIRLSRNVAIEQTLGFGVLALVSVLGTLPPGDHSETDPSGPFQPYPGPAFSFDDTRSVPGGGP